jgi:hypothetical protein
MRTKSIKIFAVGAVASLAIAGSAQARHGADDPAGHKSSRDDAAIHFRHGADDAANHNAGDDRITKARHRHHRHRHHRRHVADDPAGHR